MDSDPFKVVHMLSGRLKDISKYIYISLSIYGTVLISKIEKHKTHR